MMIYIFDIEKYFKENKVYLNKKVQNKTIKEYFINIELYFALLILRFSLILIFSHASDQS
jgi:hypothetical protein